MFNFIVFGVGPYLVLGGIGIWLCLKLRRQTVEFEAFRKKAAEKDKTRVIQWVTMSETYPKETSDYDALVKRHGELEAHCATLDKRMNGSLAQECERLLAWRETLVSQIQELTRVSNAQVDLLGRMVEGKARKPTKPKP